MPTPGHAGVLLGWARGVGRGGAVVQGCGGAGVWGCRGVGGVGGGWLSKPPQRWERAL